MGNATAETAGNFGRARERWKSTQVTYSTYPISLACYVGFRVWFIRIRVSRMRFAKRYELRSTRRYGELRSVDLKLVELYPDELAKQLAPLQITHPTMFLCHTFGDRFKVIIFA